MTQVFTFQLPNDDNYYDVEGIYSPLAFHKAGLQYTKSGYGSRIPTPWMIVLAGTKVRRRVYCMTYGNPVTCYFFYKKQRIFVT